MRFTICSVSLLINSRLMMTFEKLSKLIEAFPEKYELKNYEFNGKKQIGYKCKKSKSRGKKK